MSSASNLAVLMAPMTTLATHSVIAALGQAEDTLLRILLRTKCIQGAVIEAVIDRMLALCVDGAAESAPLKSPYHQDSNQDLAESDETCGDGSNKELSVLCFNHLRWCDNIQHPEDLLGTLLEALQVDV